MKQLSLVLPVLALLSACATQTSTPVESQEVRFVKFDVNKDGKISKIELGQINTQEAFFYYDSDGNKIVTSAEFYKLGGTPELFGKLDKNKSGDLTLAEVQANPRVLTQMSATFETIDVNKDGGVDKVEAKSWQTTRQNFTP